MVRHEHANKMARKRTEAILIGTKSGLAVGRTSVHDASAERITKKKKNNTKLMETTNGR